MVRTGTENRGLRQALIVLMGAGMVALTASAAHSEQPDAKLQAQLAAGEFAPALAAAQQAANPQQRDAALAKVAAAQAQAGAPVAAVKTVAQIGDDRARAGILAAVGGGAAPGVGGAGANANNPNGADFKPLMDLIQNTVATKSWIDNGGNGTISEFPTGVWVDPNGVLRPLMREARSGDLAAIRNRQQGGQEDVHASSPLRMISLNRLEKQIQLDKALGQNPDEAMKYLAGLRRVQYVFAYPETGDLVIAGPAGDWTTGAENRIVSTETGDPVVRLDDLVVVFRHMMKGSDAYFGCKIDPRKEGLKGAEDFAAQWKGRKLPPGDAARKAYCEQLAAAVGKQDIDVFGGLDPETRAARTLVEADYRMKLVGMGLEPGVPGMTSYMSLLKSPPTSITMLRWWFTLNYDSVQTAQDHLAFNIRGQGVKVQSENEHLTATGERVHTGESEPLNQQFVDSFTKHFDELSAKYPIYAELRNICDLALAASLVREEGLADKVGWHMSYFGDPQAFAVEKCPAPKEVDSVVNYRVLNHGVFLVQVSGGVTVKPGELTSRKAMQVESDRQLQQQRPNKAAKAQAGERWWWD
jgi:hypothetical protein